MVLVWYGAVYLIVRHCNFSFVGFVCLPACNSVWICTLCVCAVSVLCEFGCELCDVSMLFGYLQQSTDGVRTA